MISDHTRRQVWQEWQDSHRVEYYYQLLAKRRGRQKMGVRTGVLFSISGGFSPLIAAVPQEVGLCLTTAAVLLTLIDAQINWGAQAAVASFVNAECAYRRAAWRELWEDVEGQETPEEEVKARMKELQGLDIRITTLANVTHSDHLNRKASRKTLVRRSNGV